MICARCCSIAVLARTDRYDNNDNKDNKDTAWIILPPPAASSGHFFVSRPRTHMSRALVAPVAQVVVSFTLASLVTELLMEHTVEFGALVLLVQAIASSAWNLYTYRAMRRTEASTSAPPVLYGFYVALAALDAAARLLGAAAHGEGATVSLALLFRSSSPLWIVGIGILFFGYTYTRARLVPVALITLGMALVSGAESLKYAGASAWAVGALYSAAFLGALLGHLQRWGQRWIPHSYVEEQLAVQALALPMLLLRQPSPLALPWSATTLALLAVAAATHVLGMNGIYALLERSDALTVTLAVTLRKFVSIAASAALFGSSFTYLQWTGGALCLVGSALYAQAMQPAV